MAINSFTLLAPLRKSSYGLALVVSIYIFIMMNSCIHVFDANELWNIHRATENTLEDIDVDDEWHYGCRYGRTSNETILIYSINQCLIYKCIIISNYLKSYP
jgi:hypothetical protein